MASLREPTNRDKERLRHVSNRFPLPLRSDKRSDECRDERDIAKRAFVRNREEKKGLPWRSRGRRRLRRSIVVVRWSYPVRARTSNQRAAMSSVHLQGLP